MRDFFSIGSACVNQDIINGVGALGRIASQTSPDLKQQTLALLSVMMMMIFYKTT